MESCVEDMYILLLVLEMEHSDDLLNLSYYLSYINSWIVSGTVPSKISHSVSRVNIRSKPTDLTNLCIYVQPDFKFISPLLTVPLTRRPGVTNNRRTDKGVTGKFRLLCPPHIDNVNRPTTTTLTWDPHERTGTLLPLSTFSSLFLYEVYLTVYKKTSSTQGFSLVRGL